MAGRFDLDRLKRGLRLRPLAALGIVASAFVLAGLASTADDEPEPVGGPEMLRRLTEEQYRATIADVFAPDIPVNARFEAPVRSEGLISVGTGEAGMSPFAVEQYEAAAEGIATEVLSEKRRKEFMPCLPANARQFDPGCARQFVEDKGLLLFRRPLTESESDLYVEAARQSHERLGDFYGGLKLSLYAMLVSPDFLFRMEKAEPGEPGPAVELDAWSKASRLSFFLTNSSPDRELLEAAADGDLDSWWGLRRQVDRLMDSHRFEGAVKAFFADMLEFDEIESLSKDPAIYPAYNSDLAADATEQTLRTIVDHLLEEEGDYRDLFTTRKAFLTRPLGVVYRLPVATRGAWEESVFPEGSGRMGIQSHAAFLALHSHPGRSSPTLRGYALRSVFLCQDVPDPPANVNFSAVEDALGKPTTARDRLVLHMTEPACAGCHKVMDPIGLALENFDGVGAWRRSENGIGIDVSGTLDGTDFTTVEDLARALRNHRETPRCLAEKLYKSAVGRDITWDERPYLDWLIGTFEDEGYRVPDLMRAIALSDNFFTVRPEPGRMVKRPARKGDRS